MNTPELHVIDTKMETIPALHLSIPSPFENNKVLSALVEIHPQPNRQVYIELWGPLPAFEFTTLFTTLPEQRAKFSSGYVTYPHDKRETYRDFCDNMAKVISESPVFTDGIREMLALHRDAQRFRTEA